MKKEDEFDTLRGIILKVVGVDIKEKTKRTDYIYARMVFYTIMRSKGHTLESIGRYVGKDHATVLWGSKNFDNLITRDEYLREMYFECSKSFNPTKVWERVKVSSLKYDLQSRIDSLILENGKLQDSKKMYIRFKNIIKEMDERTPHGMEHVLHAKITMLLNGNIFK